METLSHSQLEAEELAEAYKARERDWRAFLNTPAWFDLRMYILGAVEEAKELLSIEKEERSVKESDDSLRGGIKIARRILAFPQEQLDELLNEERQRTGEEENA